MDHHELDARLGAICDILADLRLQFLTHRTTMESHLVNLEIALRDLLIGIQMRLDQQAHALDDIDQKQRDLLHDLRAMEEHQDHQRSRLHDEPQTMATLPTVPNKGDQR